ncbi:hypothetical protein V5799_006741 [Amblyomma americanum]|uniref:Uncharacterized protein n=1 Tax=Amblyomma americanum TaxID=6943 RepID=A0AAQ4DVI8_AMBAM
MRGGLFKVMTMMMIMNFYGARAPMDIERHGTRYLRLHKHQTRGKIVPNVSLVGIRRHWGWNPAPPACEADAQRSTTGTPLRKKPAWFFGTFFASAELRRQHKRNHALYNGVTISKKGKKDIGINFTLIYSDYKTCSILRVPHEYLENGCRLLATPQSLQNGRPKNCLKVYEKSCGNISNFKQVFKPPSRSLGQHNLYK